MTNYIKLHVVSTVLSEEGLEKVESAQSSPESKKNKNGLTKEMCEDLNIPIPKDLQDESNQVVIGDEDIEIIENPHYINLDKVLTFGRTDFNGHTTVYLTDDLTLDVRESPKQIYRKIKNIKYKQQL